MNHGWFVHTEAVRGDETRKAREHCIGFVDLEKAFDTVSREMVMATLR